LEATEEGVAGGEGTLADRDISHTLHLADRFAELLPVNGASIVVRSGPDNTQLVHATDDVVAQLDDLQFTLGEGPCLDAFRLREPVLVSDLGRPEAFARWPGFAHEATQAGAFAAFAFPLQVGTAPFGTAPFGTAPFGTAPFGTAPFGTAPFGTVELYRSEPGSLSERDTAIALLIVDELVSVVLDDLTGRDRRHDPGGARPVPLFGRAEIPQATGMIAVQLGVSIPEALAQLRAAAFAVHRPILDIAEDVIGRRLVFSPDRR